MASLREQTESWSLEQLCDVIGNENTYAPHARAEILRRTTIAQDEALAAQKQASEAQELAAIAAVDTAEYTKANAKYMLWSVCVLTVFSVISTLFSTWDHFMRSVS